MKFVVTQSDEGKRLDKFLLVQLKPHLNISRSALSSYIQTYVKINDQNAKKGWMLKANDVIEVEIEEIERDKNTKLDKDIAAVKGQLNIIEETDDYIVLNKQSGIAVHPGKDNEDNTIANFLKYYLEEKGEYDPEIIRGGIVHRLDKLVSGLLICAKNRKAQIFLQMQFEAHTVVKLYLAQIEEKDDEEGMTLEEALTQFKSNEYEPSADWRKIDGKISRDHKNRMRMILGGRGKTSLTFILPLRGDEMLVNIKTGRMHQIRATLKSLGLVIKGDSLYGSKVKQPEISLKQILLRLEVPKLGIKEWSL